MKKLLSILLITCLPVGMAFYFLLFTYSSVYAVSPTPTPKPTVEDTNSATSSSSKDDQIKARVQERIEGIKNRVFEQAFWGTLVDVNNSTLIVKTAKGERIIKTNDQTKIIDQNKKAVKIADLEIGNFLIVNGVTEQDTFTAKRIVVLKTTPKPKPAREVAHGKITKITEKTKLLNLAYKDQVFKVTVNDKTTTITKKVEDKVQKLTFADLAENDYLVAVGTIDENTGIITTKIIHVIPGLSKVSPTPSVKASPTPSTSLRASPTPKVSPTLTITPTPTKKPTLTPTSAE